MATLSKHNIVGKVELLSKSYAVSDKGKTYVNYGRGWKEHGKLKEGVTPSDYLATHERRLKELEEHCPSYTRFKKLFKASAPANCRWQVMEALRTMGSDYDGILSELNEHAGYEMRDRLTLEDIVELVRAYKSYHEQLKEVVSAGKISR